MKSDAGQASLDNILNMAMKLAFIQKLNLPQDILSVSGRVWVEQIVCCVDSEKACHCASKASVARDLNASRVIVYRALASIDGQSDT